MLELTDEAFQDKHATLRWDEYLWAAATFQTRHAHATKMFKHPSAISRSASDSAIFAPIVELFNHRPRAAVRSCFNQRRGTFEVVVQAPVKKGEQIFIEYLEDADVDSIFVDYGFVLDPVEASLRLDEKTIFETAAVLGYPNLKQLSRRAKELTDCSRWRVELHAVSQEAEAALLVYSCGHLDNVDELFQNHKNTAIFDLAAHKAAEPIFRNTFIPHHFLSATLTG
ncbi:unnamed protein product [Oikopleura dioica]|nr:unnamed protein product [Oikopleura dioica]